MYVTICVTVTLMTMVDTAAIGRKGGKARAKNMTAAERSEAMSKASKARWAKAKKTATKKAGAK